MSGLDPTALAEVTSEVIAAYVTQKHVRRASCRASSPPYTPRSAAWASRPSPSPRPPSH